MKAAETVNLCELIRIQMHKDSIDELSRMDKWEKKYLAGVLKALNPCKLHLSDWNQLLELLVEQPPADNEKTARNALISALEGKD